MGYVRGVSLLAVVFIITGCVQWYQEEDSWDWEVGDGKTVKIRIDLRGASRFSLPLDNPAKEYVDYYEVVFREQGTSPVRYYMGTAFTGESIITVAVPSGKTYDILVLAGTPANRNVTTGIKVLLASGWIPGYSVIYGRNTLSVPMSLHITEDTFFAQMSGAQETYSYTPRISGVAALLQASGPLTDAAVFRNPRSFLLPYPSIYADEHRVLPIPAITAAGDAMTFTIAGNLPDKAKEGVTYQCYYNITYYAFSDPASGSSPWDIRRGIVNTLYTDEASYFGGGIPIRYWQYYYVDGVHGNDADDGLTEAAALKTLACAVQKIRSTASPIPWIQTIMVLGELNDTTEQANRSDEVFIMQDPAAGERDVEIRITGSPAAKLAGTPAKRVISIVGNHTKVQLDHIEITGGDLRSSIIGSGGGIYTAGGAKLTLGDGVYIHHNTVTDTTEQADGGGIFIGDPGTSVTMKGTARIENNTSGGTQNSRLGGGVKIYYGTLIMEGGSISYNHAARYGGGLWVDYGELVMTGGAIRENTAGEGGGGVDVRYSSASFTMSGGTITGNRVGKFSYGGNGTGSGNGSNGGGAGVRIEENATFTMTGGFLTENYIDAGTPPTLENFLYGPNGGTASIASNPAPTWTGRAIRENIGAW